MAVYPGDSPVRFTTLRTIKDTGYHVSELCMSTHAGTHVDVPFHVILDDRTVDKLPLESLVGEAEVLDLGDMSHGDEITSAHLDPFAARVSAGARLLLKTGWGKRWGEPGYFDDFPSLSEGAAMWLASRKVAFVGIETPSMNPRNDKEVHKTLLSAGVVAVENIANLDQLTRDRVFLVALPLKLAGLDGAPVRAIAIED